MYENDYMYAIERNDDYLAHYGIRGMKWGVRKAIERGNSRALGRQYRKAQKKLAKLEKRAASGKKYVKRAALLGAGAAAAGGLAGIGTRGLASAVGNAGLGVANATKGLGNALQRASHQRIIPMSNRNRALMRRTGGSLVRAGGTGANAGSIVKGAADASGKIFRFGESTSISKGLGRAVGNIKLSAGAQNALVRATGSNPAGWGEKIRKSGVTNNTIARIGAGAIGAGLAGAAGYNAYRAATTKRAAKKAAQFRKAMNESFRGTQYANGGAPRQGKKRRR